MLVGNKCDLEQERKVTVEMGEEKARNLNCPFFETSALNNTQIEKIFQVISEDIYSKSKNEKKDDEDDDYDIVQEEKNININTDTKPSQKTCC